MKALVLTPEAFGGYGGIAQYNRDFLTALCRHTTTTEIICHPRHVTFAPETLPQRLTYAVEGIGSKWRYTAAVLSNVWRRGSVRLVICGHINLLPLAAMMRSLLGAPLVLMIYGIDAWEAYQSELSRHLVRQVDAVFSISETTRQHFEAWAPPTIATHEILPNAIHLERYGVRQPDPELIERYGLQGRRVLMTFGRLDASERYKGVDEVLESMHVLRETLPNLVYLVAGDGSDRVRLEAKAATLGLSEHVRFTGFVSEAEKAAHYSLADAFVLASTGEGFGFVLLEALASGVPTIASRLDGGREALRDGLLGQLVDPHKPADLHAGIFAALQQHRGKVPDALGYFSYSNFEARVHAAIDRLIEVPFARQQVGII